MNSTGKLAGTAEMLTMIRASIRASSRQTSENAGVETDVDAPGPMGVWKTLRRWPGAKCSVQWTWVLA
jgi:hypothetical protein